MARPTLVTVTWNSWETYTQRLIEQVCHYVSPDDYEGWLMVDNGSEDGDIIERNIDNIPDTHRSKFTLIKATNIGDLPQYNRVFRQVRADKIIVLSPDIRICAETIPWFSQKLEMCDIVGTQGPNLPRAYADPAVGGTWHWVPKLLVDRGIDFDYTMHVQTWCFAVKKAPFYAVGGFWEPEDGKYLDKGNLISGEMSISIRLRLAGYTVGAEYPIPAYHYGNIPPEEGFDVFDMARGWPRYRRLLWDV